MDLNSITLISRPAKDVYSKRYLMQKEHKADQRLQKKKQKDKEKANYKGEN